jgi:hypothetical protein
MNGEVGRPHSVVDLALSEVPLLEVVASVFLMGRVDLRGEDHLVHEFSLLETLVHEQVILLVHGSVAALAGSLENFEASPQTINKIINDKIF